MSTVPAPTVDEIMAIPAVQAELEAAWVDSLPHDPVRRHEEGGWVYFSDADIEFRVRRATGGGRAYLDLNTPPELDGYFVVATFHTHPNPASEGWDTGPSRADTYSAHVLGVPCIISFVRRTAFTRPARPRAAAGWPAPPASRPEPGDRP